jgi:CBS domain containing-hemolysin-like protein
MVTRYLKPATFIQAVFFCVVKNKAVQNFYLALYSAITDSLSQDYERLYELFMKNYIQNVLYKLTLTDTFRWCKTLILCITYFTFTIFGEMQPIYTFFHISGIFNFVIF